MTPSRRGPLDHAASPLGLVLALAMVLVLVLPVLALALSTTPTQLRAGLSHPIFAPALWLSLRTTGLSVVLIAVGGTPLAWWLAHGRSGPRRVIEVLVELPIVLPPAVVGVALLAAFGRQGLLGPALEALGIELAFRPAAVVVAQVVVAAPFFVQAAANAFRKVELDTLIVARTLGASPREAFFRVAVPVALPGLITGAALAWARALGEFGATLLFAGNLQGQTQTLPLAIFSALETDVRLAVVLALILAAGGGLLLVALRLVPRIWGRARARAKSEGPA